MWKALAGFILKALGAVTAYFVVRKGGKDAQKLDDAQDTIEGVEKRDEIEREHRNDDSSAAYERLRNRNR